MPYSQSSDDYARSYTKNFIGGPIIRPMGPGNVNINNILDTGRIVRDFQLWELPILPEAIMVFQQLASSREWAISGKIRAAQRAVEWFNEAVSTDPMTGQTYYGFQSFEQRRVLDALTVGRTAFYAADSDDAKLEYIDPTYLRFYRNNVLLQSGVPDPVRPDELVWQYQYSRNFKAGEIFLDHLIPVGTHFFIPPIAAVLRTARLAWLIKQHDEASLDGRKIRDIFIIGNEMLSEAIESAITQAVAAWSGADPTRLAGVQVIGINNPGGQPVENQIFTLGLSKLPENFDRAQFEDGFVNQISAAIGLSLREFWNSKSAVTNRSVEEVAEVRQTRKGPSLYVKSEERLINNSAILDRFGTGKNKVRFGFIEETDLGSRLTNAQVLRETTAALKDIYTVFGQTITLESYLAWMQNLGTMPFEIELSEAPITPDSTSVINPDNSAVQQGQTSVQGTPDTTSFPEKALDYDEVQINHNGEILDKRVKVFSVFKLLENEEVKSRKALIESIPDDEDAFKAAIAAVSEENRNYFIANYVEHLDAIDNRVKMFLIPEVARNAIVKCTANEALSPAEQGVIDTLVDYIRSDWVAGEDES